MSVKKLIAGAALAAAVVIPAAGVVHSGSAAPRVRADFGWDVVTPTPPVTK